MAKVKGLVGIIANDSARYSLFASSVTRLQLPDGFQLEWLIGGDWCGARNSLGEIALNEGFDYLWFMDDDHAFSPDILMKLVRHDVDIVMPVCLTRVTPFAPVEFTEYLGDGKYLPLYLPDQPESGLVEVVAGGTAGMLIKREVFEAIPNTKEKPWFEYGTVSEDIIFCEKAKKAGFKLYCDLETRLGHITTAVVWPTPYEDTWGVGFNIGRDTNIVVGIEPREGE